MGDPLRKGRAIFLGDNLEEKHFSLAEFAGLGSSPPTTEAARPLDAMGNRPGYCVKTSDARGA